MVGVMFLVAAVAAGVDAGWQPLPEGGMEYIIQIEPHSIESLRAGEEITCEMPPSLGVTCYRIRVGTAPLPHEEPPKVEKPPEPAPSQPAAEKAADPFSGAAWPSIASGEPLSPKPSTSPGDISRSDAADAPRPLAAAPEAPARPERLAVYNQPESPGDADVQHEARKEAPKDDPASKPWLPFTLALAGFFGAFGGMLYTGWIAWDYRCRYRALLEKTLAAESEAAV